MKVEKTVQEIFGEHPYATLVEDIRDFAVFFMDVDGHIVSWNQGAKHIFGYEKAEILGEPFCLLFTLEERQDGVPKKELEKAKAEGSAEDRRWHQSKSGPRFWANGVLTAVRDETGILRGYAKVARDDTSYKQVEEEREGLIKLLETERSHLSKIFTKAPAFVAVLRGPEHIFELVNPAYYQLVGHRDLIGKGVREALPEIEGQGYFELLDRVFQTGEVYEGHELKVLIQRERDSPLEERFVNLLNQPFTEADGTVSGIFVHGVDITGQVRARQEAEESNRTKDEFLATLSHELRTPLNSILGWAHILRTARVADQEIAIGLESIERNAKAQAQLIEDILDVSRVITGKMRLEVQPVDLASVIAEAANSVLPAAEAKGISLQRVLDSSVSMVSGDRARLQQVVWNLLSNAMKFTPKGGHVQIRLGNVDSHVEVIVSDNGQGIDQATLPHIFERFRQADSTSTRGHSGLGLGLALVRHMVELHGGSVEARSDGIERGTVFTVKLPLIAVRSTDARSRRQGDKVHREGNTHVEGNGEAPPSVNGESVVLCPPQLKDLHILVVDDEKDARLLLTAVLEGCGARVTAVASAQQALAVLIESRPAVLVSDIGMAGEDGYFLIRKVRALSQQQGGGIPALALTAYAGMEDRMKILQDGFDFYLSKPVEPMELVSVVVKLAGGFGKDSVRIRE